MERARETTRERVETARETTRERVESARESTRERVETARESTRERVERARMTTRRLFGLDRSGPAPRETLADQPWRVWTLPNAVSFARVLLLVPFVWLVVRDGGGPGWVPALVFLLAAGSDYLDGLLARVTGQYSRFGALLDPITDRLVVIAGVVACFWEELLPQWMLLAMIGRELFMLVTGQLAIRARIAIEINWWGRLAIWPVMAGLVVALVGYRDVATGLFAAGLAMSVVATALYTRKAFDPAARGTADAVPGGTAPPPGPPST